MTNHVFQDTSSLVKWLRLSMIMWLVVAVLMLLVEFIYSTIIYHNTGIAEGGVVYRWGSPALWEIIVVSFFPVVKILISLQYMVFLLLWVYRAQANNWALGIGRLSHSPDMAVVWFIIPLVNLFYPFMVLSELFKASDPDSDTPRSSLTWEMSAPPSMLTTWWLGWILVTPLAMPPFVMQWIFSGMDMMAYRVLELIVYMFMVVLMFVFWKMANDHHEMQNRKYELIFGETKDQNQY